ncbi:hypothetical protein CPC08DRAFT_729763 [Agrocybe pediades]|nr:hypothetical protein CPC08DRAFT_729763 [Agrocybe pediades]
MTCRSTWSSGPFFSFLEECESAREHWVIVLNAQGILERREQVQEREASEKERERQFQQSQHYTLSLEADSENLRRLSRRTRRLKLWAQVLPQVGVSDNGREREGYQNAIDKVVTSKEKKVGTQRKERQDVGWVSRWVSTEMVTTRTIDSCTSHGTLNCIRICYAYNQRFPISPDNAPRLAGLLAHPLPPTPPPGKSAWTGKPASPFASMWNLEMQPLHTFELGG